MGVRGRNIVEVMAIVDMRGKVLVVSNCHLILVLLEDGNRVREVE